MKIQGKPIQPRRSKYWPLYKHLHDRGGREVTLSFAEIEALLGATLPSSAREVRGWWSNRASGSPQATAWRQAGYYVADLNLAEEQVTFRKAGLYEVRWDGDVALWNGEMIRALRLHAGWSQGRLAEEMGVRQQTISEWETGLYAPSRAMCKYLSLIAERAGFKYGGTHAVGSDSDVAGNR